MKSSFQVTRSSYSSYQNLAYSFDIKKVKKQTQAKPGLIQREIMLNPSQPEVSME